MKKYLIAIVGAIGAFLAAIAYGIKMGRAKEIAAQNSKILDSVDEFTKLKQNSVNVSTDDKLNRLYDDVQK